MTTEKANYFVEKSKHNIKQNYRLSFHMMPEVGWMNDPNGLIFYKGEYHVFYQHYPYDSVWGSMHWGHIVSKDLIRYEYLPIALAPDQKDEDGCFSGGAIVDKNDENLLHLFYTKHKFENGKTVEQQGLATSTDGVNFIKNSNPIIDKFQIAPYGSVEDNRDPAPIYRNGYYYILLGTKDESKGKFLIYRSKDLKSFEYYDVFTHESLKGCMAECPDLVTVDGTDIFLYSVIDFNVNPNKNYSKYLQGTFDIEKKKYQMNKEDCLDSGHHFYAPQSLVDDKGRTIIIAWMEMWGDKNVTHELGHGWQGALTFPRELKVIDNVLYQYPIEEIKHYYTNTVKLSDKQTIDKAVDVVVLKTNEAFDIRVENTNDKEDYFQIEYDGNRISIDGLQLKVNPLPIKYSKREYKSVELRILMDQSSIEIFVNNGIETFTSRIYIESNTVVLKTSRNIKGFIHNIEVGE